MKRRGSRFLLLGVALYVVLPYLLVQRLGLGLIREGKQRRRELTLTFDDGPDPASTPAVLDVLAAAGARATFFVTLPNAQAHPELVGRMLTEGHEVAPHAVLHRHAWIRTPWGAALEPLRAARQLQELTGQPVRLYRPPHGAYTLATLLGVRWAGLVGAHWSAEGRDWHPASTPESMVRHVIARVHPGAVVVLHDAGPGARNTVPALLELLRSLGERGYGLVTLSELEGAVPLDWKGLPRRSEAVFCISALRPLLESLGFETFPVPILATRRLSLWATVLRRAYGTPVKEKPQPALSVLSMERFLERYGE